MPARKPSSLIQRNDVKADIEARSEAESAMTPKTELTVDLPALLRIKENKIAAQTWARIVGLYNETAGKIATAFDMDLLIKYCLLEQEVLELGEMRATIKKDWEDNQKAAKKMKPTAKNIKEWVHMWEVVNSLFQRFQGLDARLDGKRKLLLSLSQSLYLTPRSRAGVAPKQREHEEKDNFGEAFDK